jgi:hypothetical protein
MTLRDRLRLQIKRVNRDRIDPVRIMTIIFATVFVLMILWIFVQEL